MKALIHLYIAGLKEFIREPMALFWTVAFPISFVIMFGTVFAGSNDPSYEIGVLVEDSGQAGTALGEVFQSVEVFEIAEGDRETLEALLADGEIRALIVIPEDLTQQIAAGEPASVEVRYDPSNQVTAQIVLTIVEKVVDAFDREITGSRSLVSIEPVTVTSSDLRTIDFMLPGVLAMALMQLGLFGTAPALVALREQQILRRLGATPLPRATLLASQVMQRLTIGFGQMGLILILGVVVFDVAILGSLALLAAIALLGALTFVAMGYMISAFAKTQESVTGITSILNFPMMFLSGVFFPVEIMPDWIQPVVKAIPLSYLSDALRHLMVGAPSAFGLGLDVAVLGAWLLVCSVLALRFFRWE